MRNVTNVVGIGNKRGGIVYCALAEADFVIQSG